MSFNFAAKVRQQYVLVLLLSRIYCAHLASTHENRWLFLGTTLGNMFIFDTEKLRLSAYSVSSNGFFPRHSSSTSMVPTITDIAQKPGDESQLLVCFNNGEVLSWHTSDQKVHRRYQLPKAGRSSLINDLRRFQKGKLSLCLLEY